MERAQADDCRQAGLPAMVTIGLVQYSTTHRIFLPYSVGLLQASLARAADPERFYFLLPRVYVAPLAGEVEALRAADVVAFSIFVWNEQRSLALAQRLKASNPKLLIIFGGPQVPDQAEGFLRANPWIDLCVHGEGEDVFLQLMEAYPARPWNSIPGLSWIAKGEFFHTAAAAKRRDLDVYPSPFLSGVFDELMAAHPEQSWSTTWESNRGCPFTCVFCDWGSATASRVNRFGMERLLAEIDWFATRQIDYIFCADANFGILPRDIELARYAAEAKRRTGFPRQLVVQNAKNVTERSFEIQCIMAEAGLDPQITISLQSLHPPTLEASGRKNISLEAFETLSQRLRAQGIHTYTDLIVGLPLESYDTFADGLSTLIGRGQYHALQIFCADILPNAPMADPAFRARYGIETVKMPNVSFRAPVLEDPDGIVEVQHTVIATSTMPREDWVRTRVLTWMVDMLFYKPGTVRIPLLMLHRLADMSLRPMLEAFMAPDPRLKTLNWVWRFFCDKARRIQQGESEYCQSLEQDGRLVWWSPCEAILDLLLRQRRLEAYYQEAHWLLQQLARPAGLPEGLLEDALFLSASFIQSHSLVDLYPLVYHTRWNVWDYYQGVLKFEEVALSPEHSVYLKDWPGAPFKLRCLRGSSSHARPHSHPAGPPPGLRAGFLRSQSRP
ncbi:MAG: hypothetical protein CVV27_17555 [Candidatus Melainabacteria bacterium HGW-Melainabacteria-1]|nr:MAG: hypothetical protein CVV27_17555 [Candidatus Melainabacteria bacterium HGW-Melainabacteria-1]